MTLAYLAIKDRDAGFCGAYLDGGYTQTAIAAVTGLSISRISRVINAGEARNKTWPR